MDHDALQHGQHIFQRYTTHFHIEGLAGGSIRSQIMDTGGGNQMHKYIAANGYFRPYRTGVANYASHFGGLSKLSEGDGVIFTDMDGITTAYEVVAQDVLHPYAVEEMTSGDFDLTLFTCTYGGKSRVTVYCDRVS